MNINRHNYEEYFILYMDNELSAEERRQVEHFVTLHPDLKEELDMLMHTQLVPDHGIVYESKADLLQESHSSTTITLSNYDEWLVLYTDNELNKEQRAAVEKFVAENPAMGKELEIYQQAKLYPEAISFPNKESLYRREEKVRRIPVWLRYAAAAAIVLAIGTTSIIIVNNNKKEVTGLTETVNTPSSKVTENTNTVVPANEVNLENSSQVAQSGVNPEMESTSIKIKENKNPSNRSASMEAKIEPTQKEDLQIANNVIKNNNLPLPDQNPNVISKLDNSIAGINDIKSDSKTLTTKQSDPETSPVTNPANDAYNVGVPDKQPDDEIVDDDQPSGKKNKLRGFFRKVTRTFEKRTSIDPTNGDDRLLVGGLSIKLK
jgi:anti-sigma factor RsiW